MRCGWKSPTNPPEHMEGSCSASLAWKADVYRVEGPEINLVAGCLPDPGGPPRPNTAPSRRPAAATGQKNDLLAAIRKGDVLLHHPYQSFQPVIDLLNIAATDPQVVAIKMTVWPHRHRIRPDGFAAGGGAPAKQVTVVVELMARFDEEANIGWASRLEDAGACGVRRVRLQDSRQDADGGSPRRRASCAMHPGTGNYPHRPHRACTPTFGLMTCNEEMPARQRHQLVDHRPGPSGRSLGTCCNRCSRCTAACWVSAAKFQFEHVHAGCSAAIIIRWNFPLAGAASPLYEAPQAGLKICLIIRGVWPACPGVPGLSDNIEVRSVVGRFHGASTGVSTL